MNVFELRVRGSSDPATFAAIRRLLSFFPEVRRVHPTQWLDTIAVLHDGDGQAEWARTLEEAGHEVEWTAEGWPLEREPDAAA